MAGGRGNSKQIGHTNKTRKWLSHHHLHNSITPESFFGERFRKRESIEWKNTTAKTIAEFHEHILRTYTDSLFCDFNIINGHNVIQTNQCIVRTRSPHFYEALEPYFVHTNKTIDCIIDIPGLFQQIKRFVRLLYENVDLLRDEQLLVQAITNITFTPRSIEAYQTNDTSDDNNSDRKDIVIAQNLRNIKRYAAVDLSPTSSDMADSGLETGSVSPHENTTSENSSTDLEESQTAGNACPTEDTNRIQLRRKREKIHKPCTSSEYCDTSSNCSGYGTRDLADQLLTECTSNDHSGTCSSVEVEQHQFDSSSSSNENAQRTKAQAEEIYQYENQVLSDPFYESDCGSDENESFEFINPSNISSLSTDAERDAAKVELLEEKQDEKSSTESSREKEDTEETMRESPRSANLPSRNTASGTSSYYFIDASTLNDEVDVLTTNRSKDTCVGLPQTYSPYSSDYTPSRSSHVADEQCSRYTAFKPTSRLTGHERVAEFERELKLTEYLKPFSESRKIKRVDSGSEEKADTDKATEKESLVVEIKEADSGESTQHSPCPDNNANIVNKRTDATKEAITSSDSALQTIDDDVHDGTNANDFEESEGSNKEVRRPSLIRGNTFELDSNDEKLSLLRQEYERRQGSLVFQSSIPQYSGHRVDGDSCFDPCDEPALPSTNEVISKFPPDFPVPVSAQYHTSSCLSLDSCKNGVVEKPAEITYLSKNDVTNPSGIYPVAKSASDKLVVDPCLLLEDTEESYSNSLPVTLSSIIEKDKRFDTMKRTKRDETTPIISGGASTSDFTKPTDSPTVRRKTESTPIVSGGSIIMSEPEVKVKPSRMSSSMTAWVVDMSDCGKNDYKATAVSNPSGMSQSFSNSECLRKPVRKISSQEKQSSLGFFVNLKDMDSKNEPPMQKQVERKEQNGNGKPYCEFYVDISNRNGTSKSEKPENVEVNSKVESSAERSDKKNIFSMFIDLSDPPKTRENNSSAAQKKSLTSSSDKRTGAKLDEPNSSETSSTTLDDQSPRDQKSAKEKAKPSVFMFIESDSPVVRRRTLSSSRPAFNRHSWNIDKSQSSNGNGHVAKELMFRKEHKRAHSLSVDRGELKKLQGKSSSSNHSLSDAGRAESLNHKSPNALQEQENNRAGNMDTSSEDVFEFDTRDTPPNSHIEIINEELRVSVRHHEYKELVPAEAAENVEPSEGKVYEDEYSETSAWEKTCTESTEGQTRKSETFDISSGSGPSSGSDNHDFELSDLLAQDMPNDRTKPAPSAAHKISETHKSLNETIKKIESELEAPEYKSHAAKIEERPTSKGSDPGTASCSFVRLSDLDNTSRRGHLSDIVTVKEDKSSYLMSNSIPETSWIESKLVMTRGNGPIRAIPRKFTSIMSTSLPPKQKSPLEDLTGDGEAEGIISESDLSSMQSSMGRSGAEGSTEETETSSLAGGKPYNRLGEDLLRMFLEEINPDVTIDVGGRRIRAHKCILSSRCQYFAAILSGAWVENAGNVISLQGYSYNAVHFALCHIYSGESNIPDSISIVELATLADMLCLEGLKEVIGYTLKVKYCHLFHKPCQICAVGVLECMPLAAAYGLDEVYRKSLRWITRHFVRIWPCKAFATLPRELMEKCYHQHIVHMSTDNVLQTMMDCDKLLATLPNVRWAEPVFRMVSNLLETSVKFLSDNFAGILGNENFQSLGRELTWNISRLEDNFLAAAERLPPEQACKSYSKLHKMLASTQVEDPQMKPKWGPLFVDFLKKIQSRVEKCLVRDAARAARTTTWLKMDLELRRRIQELACLVILPHETTKRPSRHSNFLKEPRAPSSRSTASRSLDLKRVKMVISEHNDKTLKQTNVVQQPKKPLNKPKSDPLERKVQEEKQATTEPAVRPKSWPNKIEVKSRYLEPRKPVVKETTAQNPSEKVSMPQRRKIMISSSDSSRTSSPAMKRATDKKPLAKMKLPVKKDVKALSSDSLTESTMSKGNNRKDALSKSCGITRPESPFFRQKTAEIGLSVDSLAESKKKPVAIKKKTNKMDTSMSTDSLMTEISATPKSSVSNKLSPTLSKGVAKMQIYDKTKKNSPPTQQRNVGNVVRRPLRTLESSTAASRSRAAAISAYHGSPSLRRNLLDAAKTPDIPSKTNNVVSRTSSAKQPAQVASPLAKRDKKDSSSNQQSSESPSKKSSPKSSAANRPSRATAATKKAMCKVTDDKVKAKCHNGDTPKQPTVGSRSGTFLKDEPTILKKADIKSAQISTA